MDLFMANRYYRWEQMTPAQNFFRVASIVFGGLLMALLSFTCLFAPEIIRNYGLRNAPKRLGPFDNPFLKWMQTPQYMWSIRLVGVIAIVGLALLLFALIRSGRT